MELVFISIAVLVSFFAGVLVDRLLDRLLERGMEQPAKVEYTIWYTAHQPDGSLWVETNSVDEFRREIKKWKGPGKLSTFKHKAKVVSYVAVITKLV